MPHQEHLQETGRQLTHSGGIRSAFARLAALIGAFVLLHLGAAHAAAPLGASPTESVEPATVPLTRVEAVRSGWQAHEPPETGWTDVTLPDIWTTRWPEFDGVVWYRVTWNQQSTSQPLAVALDYLNMAGAIYLNGALLREDPGLVEPLSRMWNTPWYRVLSAREVVPGENTLLIRVSGLAAYQPGLGPLVVGSPHAVRPLYRHAHLMRHDLQLFSLAITATLGCFFIALWSMRRTETAYGWFGLMCLAWWLWAMNQITTSTWPFSSNDMLEAADAVIFHAYCVFFSIFVFRFCNRRSWRVEIVLWLSVAAGIATLLAVPTSLLPTVRIVIIAASVLVFFVSCFVFLVLSAKSRRTDHRILSVCIVTFIIAAIHDLLTLTGVLRDNLYYTTFTSQLLMVGMAFVLAWHFVANLRRIERFNDELKDRIDDARSELTATLHRQHELEVVNARLGERLSLAHDLHDGLGGTLVSSIATLEHAPHSIPAERFLSILKELRDDLRIVIDTAASHDLGEHALIDLIAPLRHRMTRLFEIRRIDCAWRVSGLDTINLTASQNLDVMRVLQEGLTNVLKHSNATSVQIDLNYDDDALRLAIEDNGTGFDPAAVDIYRGTGMRSMQTRATRLGAEFSVLSTAGSTVVSLALQLRAPEPVSLRADARGR